MRISSHSIENGTQIGDAFALAVPWNDSTPHRYTFTVSAVDTESLALAPGFGRAQLETAIEGHVLDSDSLTVTYSLNPNVR